MEWVEERRIGWIYKLYQNFKFCLGIFSVPLVDFSMCMFEVCLKPG